MSVKYGPLGIEIKKQLGQLGWSQNRLADESGITQSAISKIMREKNRPTPDTISAIAKVLGLDPLYLMNLAGIPVPSEETDPSIEYIAQQLARLPQEVREIATDTVRKQIHAFHILVNGNRVVRQEEPSPLPPRVKKLTGRIEAMAERYEDEEALEKALSLLDSQVEVLEVAASRS